uniref:Si:ch211-157c3.4 n=1 Tax=Oryzias latipes TaxID=8090 RepID=A0A3B3H7V8_ORYLA
MSTPHSPMFHQSLNRNLNLQSSATNTVRSKACVASVSKNVPLSLSLSVFLLGFTTTKEISGSHLEAEKGNKNYAKYDVGLGRSPGMTNCPKCERQVETVVDYKAGTYAWLMCLLFICCGLILLCCLIPFFMNSFKDVYHSCPNCHKILHIEKKKCCE